MSSPIRPDYLDYYSFGRDASPVPGVVLSSGGDVDNDGFNDLLIRFSSNAYLLSAADLQSADAADGIEDGAIDLNVAILQPNSFLVEGTGNSYTTALLIEDLDGDGKGDIVFGGAGVNYQVGGVDAYILFGKDLPKLPGAPGQYKSLTLRGDNWLGADLAAVPDIDGDGRQDLLVEANPFDYSGISAPYLISSIDVKAETSRYFNLSDLQAYDHTYKFDGVYLPTLEDFDGDGVLDVFTWPYIALSSILRSTNVFETADRFDGSEDHVIDLAAIPQVFEGGFTLHPGTDEDDTTLGYFLSDMVFGKAGADTLAGGKGEDWVNGGSGADEIYGNTGFDTLYGMSGDDYLSGHTGADYLSGGTGADTLKAGSGNDQVYGNSGYDHLEGGIGSDYISGASGADLIYGNSGLDTLIGGSGLDTLSGGAGSDYLDGGKGSDELRGGAGRDTFVFAKGYNRDVIRDFSTSDDKLILNDTLWTGQLDAADVIRLFARVQNGDVVMTFGSDVLTLENLTDLAALTDDLIIV
jgi:Ca2+-binding RTX toxin-like protein